MTNPAYKAVLWDFGGVILDSPFTAFNRYEEAHGLPRDFLRRVNSVNPDNNAWARLERSAVTPEEFDGLFAAESEALGHPVAGADILPLLSGSVRPEMVEALRRISARMKTGCITNNLVVSATDNPKSVYKADVMALFHEVIESAKLGMRKPDPRIYTMMTDRLDVDPARCVYLDDLGVNLKPARELGMTTIKVIDPAAALAELERAVGFPLG